MFRPLDVATSLAASVARFGGGMSVGALGKRPKQRLELYEFEACPYCRKVREALSMLDLDAIVYPCPKSGPHYRQEAIKRGGVGIDGGQQLRFQLLRVNRDAIEIALLRFEAFLRVRQHRDHRRQRGTHRRRECRHRSAARRR